MNALQQRGLKAPSVYGRGCSSSGKSFAPLVHRQPRRVGFDWAVKRGGLVVKAGMEDVNILSNIHRSGARPDPRPSGCTIHGGVH
jgi:hypothetical protein